MKERSIIMSAEEVLAILDGRKTQFRRPIKWPILSRSDGHKRRVWTESEAEEVAAAIGYAGRNPMKQRLCPFGLTGDRLWVKEKWNAGNPVHPFCFGIMFNEPPQEGMKVVYQADKENDSYIPPLPWRSSVHMPRWASRLTLEITGIRVERLQNITTADIEAEGVIPYGGKYRDAWDKNHRNGPSWEDNPWVWAVDFKVDGSHKR